MSVWRLRDKIWYQSVPHSVRMARFIPLLLYFAGFKIVGSGAKQYSNSSSLIVHRKQHWHDKKAFMDCMIFWFIFREKRWRRKYANLVLRPITNTIYWLWQFFGHYEIKHWWQEWCLDVRMLLVFLKWEYLLWNVLKKRDLSFCTGFIVPTPLCGLILNGVFGYSFFTPLTGCSRNSQYVQRSELNCEFRILENGQRTLSLGTSPKFQLPHLRGWSVINHVRRYLHEFIF